MSSANPHQSHTHEPSSYHCQWADCARSFSTMLDLVTHVNIAHVPLTVPTAQEPPAPATFPAPNVPDRPSTPPSCLWGDCHLWSAPLASSSHSPTHPNLTALDLEFEALTKHFIQEHLGFPPGVSHVHTTDCPHLPEQPTIPAKEQSFITPAHPNAPYERWESHLMTPAPSSSSSLSQYETAHLGAQGTYSGAFHDLHLIVESNIPKTPPERPFPSHVQLPPDSSGSSSSTTPVASSPSSSSTRIDTPSPLDVQSLLCPCRWEGCTASFSAPSLLTAHLNTEHVGSGKKTYECHWEGCDRHGLEKCFSSKQKVMRHLQTHSGHRPFKCEICPGEVCFSEAATLAQHMRRHTNES